MRKILSLILTFTIAPTTVMTTVACKQQSSDMARIQMIHSILWDYSVEREAQLLTQFQGAVTQYDKVIKANNQYLANDIVQVAGEKGNYQVKFNYRRNENLPKYIPIVIVDLDETFMNNTPNQIYSYFKKDGRFDPVVWHQWVLKQNEFQNQIYPAVLEFVEHVWKSGGMVFFDSNRLQGDDSLIGDEAVATKKALINNGYEKAFLDSYVWWMKGVTEYGKPANDTSLNSKENRFNYINDNKIRSRKSEEMHIKNGWTDFGPELKPTDVHIIMKMGDNINDFNDNLTLSETKNEIQTRKDYMANQDIRNVFGKVGRETWFKKENEIIVQYYSGKNQIYDSSFIDKGYVQAIRFNGDYDWKITYILIGGNTQYGSWIDTIEKEYGKNVKDLEKLMWEIFKQYEKIWN